MVGERIICKNVLGCLLLRKLTLNWKNNTNNFIYSMIFSVTVENVAFFFLLNYSTLTISFTSARKPNIQESY